ncbi:MAG: hypothetical protein M1818_007556 [Claussenomyces sp. TS43310]|nr:MAG: hypothetical protein M1818_007556 [Claussenomyces sp. TS43310]
MATAKSAVDFNEIIQSGTVASLPATKVAEFPSSSADRVADRARRKNEQLAQQIFGRGRRGSAPGSGFGVRKPGQGLSLADRIGSSKRSASITLKPTSFKATNAAAAGAGKAIAAIRRNALPAGNINADWTHDLHDPGSAAVSRSIEQRRGGGVARGGRGGIFSGNGAALSPALSSQVNIVKPSRPAGGMSIRGLAGPYTVVAENFAPGTTAADIESAMFPIGGPIVRCTMISSQPVTAEISFESKDGADNVIAQFNKQVVGTFKSPRLSRGRREEGDGRLVLKLNPLLQADGLVLSLYHKSDTSTIAPASSEPAIRAAPPRGPRATAATNKRANETTRPAGRSYDRYEPPARSRDRRPYEKRDNVTDGTYGFEDQMDVDDRGNGDAYSNGAARSRGLYSDNLVGRRDGRDEWSGGGRGQGRRRDSRERGRGGERGRGYR